MVSFFDSLVLVSSAPLPANLDPNDDLKRELAFYEQALVAANVGCQLLQKEGKPILKPEGYNCENLKTVEHMKKVQDKLNEEAMIIKKAEEAKKLRLAKKFGKAVQIEKTLEKQQRKKEELENIEAYKKKRKNMPLGDDSENIDEDDEDNFGIEVEADKITGAKHLSKKSFKREKKDSKFGFGGKQRKTAKRNSSSSSADISGFDPKKNRALPRGLRAKKQRPGKSRRK